MDAGSACEHDDAAIGHLVQTHALSSRLADLDFPAEVIRQESLSELAELVFLNQQGNRVRGGLFLR